MASLSAAVIDKISFFYPLGNTPASCLTEFLPFEQDADILLLGCGDARSILFTVHADINQQRKLDITCCDNQAAVLARNVLLFALATAVPRSESVWNIYYSLFLTATDVSVLHDKAEDLLKAADSFEKWQQSKYGPFIKFCDHGTLAEVCDIWKTYCTNNRSNAQRTREFNAFKENVIKIRQFRQHQSGKGSTLTAMRSAAPLAATAAGDLGQLHEQFWKTTGLPKDVNAPNPTFRPDPNSSSTLHYGTDPLLGFHLGPIYTPVTNGTTTRVPRDASQRRAKVLLHVKNQFSNWIESFASRVEADKLVIRISAGDALFFGHMLQRRNLHAHHLSPGTYRHPYRADAMDSAHDGPATYHVIDTSNLADSLGPINVLSACADLLNRKPVSTLYLESLVKRDDDLLRMAQELLGGDLPTMSQLFGLFPVQYWTNTTVSAPEEEMTSSFFAMLQEKLADSSALKQESGQMFYRMIFKPYTCSGESPLIFKEPQLAELLYKTYLNMFQNENHGRTFSMMGLDDPSRSISKLSLPRYHRGSLAAFLGQVKNNVSANWDLVMKYFLHLVENDEKLMIAKNYVQELYTYLYLFNLHQAPFMVKPQIFMEDTAASKDFTSALKTWDAMPHVLRVTLVVPRSKLSVFSDLHPNVGMGTPTVHCSLGGTPGSHLGWMQNTFACVNLVFGKVICHGVRNTQVFSIRVEQDKSGWSGSSPLIASFWAPTSTILSDPYTSTVAFGLQSTPGAIQTYMSDLGVQLNVFQARLNDRNHVFVTRDAANLQKQLNLVKQPMAVSKTPNPGVNETICSIHGDLDELSKLVAMTGRLDVVGEELRMLLVSKAPVSPERIDPFTIALRVGTGQSQINLRIVFPVPIEYSRHKLRIARTSGYLEVLVPVMQRATLDISGDLLSLHTLDQGIPTLLNMPNLRLAGLPTLDCSNATDIQWLNPHTSFMWSKRERKIREANMGKPSTPYAKLNFKESLFSMIMQFSGLQGSHVTVFALSNTEQGKTHILILPYALKLDLNQHTVALESAVIVLTPSVANQLGPCLRAWTASGKPTCHIRVKDAELDVWKHMLPAYVERCRDWSHTTTCEYRTKGKIPITNASRESPICSCGTGKLDKSVLKDIPRSDLIVKHAVRAVISPCYSVSFVEKSYSISLDGEYKDGPDPHSCAFCARSKAADGEPLKKCAACKAVSYCSRDCQKCHWKIHKKSCRK